MPPPDSPLPEPFPRVDPGAVHWLSVDQMRQVDQVMVDELSISLSQMMENAGRNLAILARHLLGGSAAGRRVLVLAGQGGNGGGGLVAARHLASAGADVGVHLSASSQRLAPVTREQLEILRRSRLPIEVGVPPELDEPDLIVDALLGYGQEGDPRGEAAGLIELCAGRRVLSLDVPSGLELSTGTLRTPRVSAEATMTLALPKEGLRGPGAAGAVGRLYLADISVPPLAYERLAIPYSSPFGAHTIVRIQAA
jgi:NAD(P)H-hydrate epimerase